jgi:hypothetical protein
MVCPRGMFAACVALLTMVFSTSFLYGATQEVVINGGFESGDLTGWSIDAWTSYSNGIPSGEFTVGGGTTSTRSGLTIAAPSAGVYAAVLDQNVSSDGGAY